MRRPTALLTFVTMTATVAGAASPARAWGPTGHRVIGALAQERIAPHTRRAIRTILGGETLAEASTWPDDMRPDPSDFWQTQAGAWHTVTVPKGRTYAEVGPPPQGDAVTALARFACTARDRAAPLADRQLALRFIVHIVGDLHNPLHVYSGGPDRGGNAVRVRFFGQDTTWHLLWDAGFIDREQLSYSEWVTWLSPAITRADVRAWASIDPLVWIAESAALRDALPPPPAETGAVELFQARPIVRRRLQQGGVRLARYLDAVFARGGRPGIGKSPCPLSHARPS